MDRRRSTIGGGDRSGRDELPDLDMSRKFRIFVDTVCYIFPSCSNRCPANAGLPPQIPRLRPLRPREGTAALQTQTGGRRQREGASACPLRTSPRASAGTCSSLSCIVAAQQKNQQPIPPVRFAVTDKEVAAAARILAFYRVQKALERVNAVRAQYDVLRRDFVFPTQLDFVDPGNSDRLLTVNCPGDLPETHPNVDSNYKLACDPANAQLHCYSDSLNRLLVSLDEVESWGQNAVRGARQALARRIEDEARLLERRVNAVWEGRDRASMEVGDVGTRTLSPSLSQTTSSSSTTSPNATDATGPDADVAPPAF